MKFQDLPELGTAPNDQVEILVGDKGQLKQANNLFSEINDAEMVKLCLTKSDPQSVFNDHINNVSLHMRAADTTVSPISTWSSSKINSAIQGSNPWFTLDSVPEGNINKYWTADRARQVVAATTQGIVQVDHEAVAAKIVSLLLGFNSRKFRYDLINTSTPMSVSIDDGPYTLNYFECTPGVHNIKYSIINPTSQTWVCNELAHQVTLAPGDRQITPKLTLDAFENGNINKFWNNNTYGGSPLANAINTHVNLQFSQLHARINDAASSGTDVTWSASRIINFVSSEIVKNRASLGANTKSIYLGHEKANSGLNASGYSWTTTQVGSNYTHHVLRTFTSQYTNATGGFTSGTTIAVPPGSWLVYWEADMTLRTGVFSNVANRSTYLALQGSPTVPVLLVPGVIVNTTFSAQNYILVSRFTTTTPYSSSFQNSWLQPQSVAGVDELYATIQLERVK